MTVLNLLVNGLIFLLMLSFFLIKILIDRVLSFIILVCAYNRVLHPGHYSFSFNLVADYPSLKKKEEKRRGKHCPVEFLQLPTECWN